MNGPKKARGVVEKGEDTPDGHSLDVDREAGGKGGTDETGTEGWMTEALRDPGPDGVCQVCQKPTPHRDVCDGCMADLVGL